MVITITLPDKIEHKLRLKSDVQHVPISTIIVNMLVHAFEKDDELTLESFMAEVKMMPPNPASLRPASGSLGEALRNAPESLDFDLATWNKEWAIVEAEMKTITRLNDIAEEIM